jgi:hypothetical protein
MARNRLIFAPDYEFDLLGITSSAREYKLAWALNNKLSVNMVKQKDMSIELLKEGRLLISSFLFESGPAQFRLIRNKAVNPDEHKVSFLIPELQDFDFLLMIKGLFRNDAKLLTKIKSIPLVDFVSRLNLENIKSKENLIF